MNSTTMQKENKKLGNSISTISLSETTNLLLKNNKLVLDDCTKQDDYIKLFSFYLVSSNEAFEYNLSYLELQHEKYKAFLGKAAFQLGLFKDVIEKVFSSKEIKQLMKQIKQNKDIFAIILNDFFISDAAGEISICKKPNFNNIENDRPENILVVMYKNSTRSYKFKLKNDQEVEKTSCQVISMIKEIITLNLKGKIGNGKR